MSGLLNATAIQAELRRMESMYLEERDTVTTLLSQNAKLREALSECEDYFDNRADVKDGAYGEPVPNTEMRLLDVARTALAEPQL